jgi:transposase
MARETRAVWADRIGRWQRSGLTAARFGAREGVNPRTLSFWKWKLRQAIARDEPRQPRGDGAVGFVEVVRAATTAAESTPGFEVVLPSGYRIGVPPGFDRATLRTLLAVLEAPR